MRVHTSFAIPPTNILLGMAVPAANLAADGEKVKGVSDKDMSISAIIKQQKTNSYHIALVNRHERM